MPYIYFWCIVLSFLFQHKQNTYHVSCFKLNKLLKILVTYNFDIVCKNHVIYHQAKFKVLNHTFDDFFRWQFVVVLMRDIFHKSWSYKTDLASLVDFSVYLQILICSEVCIWFQDQSIRFSHLRNRRLTATVTALIP